MSNTVRARAEFSYQAKTHALECVIDLDRCTAEEGEAPDFHLMLARAHGIDPYSYLYEVLEAQEIEFNEPTGLAAGCCRDGHFDWESFARACSEERDRDAVRRIAAGELGIADLDARPDLAAAMLAAYRAGKDERPA
jgi:hypothetical protein